jgi:hypothetical protein
MSDELKNAIASVFETDPSAFKSAIFDILGAKVSDKLHAAKVDYASSVFDQSDDSDDEEYEEDSIETGETTDEEV